MATQRTGNTMTATQITILLLTTGKEAERLVKHLESFYLKVRYIPEDYIIIVKIDKAVNKYQFQNYCIGYSEVIDTITAETTDNTDISQFRKDLGFKTAWELCNNR